MAGVYNLEGMEEDLTALSTDEIEDSTAQETDITSYDEAIRKLCGLIDDDVAYLAQYLNNMKLTSAEAYEKALVEYDALATRYNTIAELAMTEGRSSIPTKQQEYIEKLQEVLNFTGALVEQIKKTGWIPVETRIEDEGKVDTTMVKSGQNGNEEVVMQNVGIIRAWWTKQNPELKTIIKAMAIGGAINGGSNVFERFFKKAAAKE